MIDRERLLSHQKELRDEWVLSVYLDASQVDPAERTAWRRKLDSMADGLRREIRKSSPDAIGAFEKALQHIDGELRPHDGFLSGQGWVGFATEHELTLAEGLPFPASDLVRWDKGPWVSPFIRALKSSRSVAVALVDSRRARVFRYRGGELAEVEDMRVSASIDDLDGRMMKAAGNHSGVRGETGTDAAERAIKVETERMLARVVERVRQIAGAKGPAVLGGTVEAAAALRAALPGELANRSIDVPSLFVEISEHDLKRRVAEAATALRQGQQIQDVGIVIDLARADGRACLGAKAIEEALDVGAVDTLYLARDMIESDPERTEALVRRVLGQSGDIEELSGEAGARLIAECGGAAARLRFGAAAAS